MDEQYQGQGIGTDLLLYVMREIVDLNNDRIKALAVEPIDEEAEDWFVRRGFGFEYVELPEPGLALPVATIRDALSNLSLE